MRIFVISLFVSLTTMATAQTYEIRSGEHADFSRLVILFGETPEWDFGRVDGGYELRISQPNVIFDISQVFNFIPRSRIRVLEMRSGSSLSIKLACQCHSDAFEIREGLVIDVKDGPATKFARFERFLPDLPGKRNMDLSLEESAVENALSTEDITEFIDIESWKFRGSQRNTIVWGENLLADSNLELQEDATSGSEVRSETLEDTMDLDLRLADMRRSLFSQISDAATQNLIVPDIRNFENVTPWSETDGLIYENPESEIFDNSHNQYDSNPVNLDPNTRIENVVERSQLNTPRDGKVGESFKCEPSNAYDVSSWGDKSTSDNDRFFTRFHIFNESYDVDKRSLNKLIRAYLFYSFGAEALSLIEDFEGSVEDLRAKKILASLMDGKALERDDILQTQVYCDTKVALWSALAFPFEIDRVEEIATEAIVSHFSDLPLHLRRHFGSLLASRFLEIDDLDSVRAIQGSISRAPGSHGDGLKMINASLELRTGDVEKGKEELSELIDGDGDLAAEAMVQLLNDQELTAGPGTTRLIEVAELMAVESEGTEISSDLRFAKINALVRSAEYIEAADLFLTEGLRDSDREKFLEYLDNYLSSMVSFSSDAQFLEIVFGREMLNTSEDIQKVARDNIAERLLQLGFSSKARDVLSVDGTVLDAESRLLFAESYLLEGRSDLAIGYLAGLSEPGAQLLRAKAYELAGDYDEASKIYLEIGDTEGQTRISFKTEDWDVLADVGTSQQKSATEILLNESNEGDDSDASISRSQDILTRSQDARAILEDLIRF